MGTVPVATHAETGIEFFCEGAEGHESCGGEGVGKFDFTPDERGGGGDAGVGSGEENVDVVEMDAGEGEDT